MLPRSSWLSQPEHSGFYVLPPNKYSSISKHPHIVLGNNKFSYKRKIKNGYVYKCTHRITSGSKGNQKLIEECNFQIRVNEGKTRLIFDIDGQDKYDAYAKLLIDKHETMYQDGAIRHDPTFNEQKASIQWSWSFMRSLVSGEFGGLDLIKYFGRLCPLQAIQFKNNRSIQSTLQRDRAKHRPKLPGTPCRALDTVKNVSSKYCWNYWSRNKLEAENMVKTEDPDIVDLVVYMDANTNVDKEAISKQLENERLNLRRAEKRVHLLETVVSIVSLPTRYYSEFVWNASEDGSCIILGSLHGALRAQTPLSTLWSKGTFTVSQQRDGTFATPFTAQKIKPWAQIQIIGCLIEAPEIICGSKFFHCFTALIKNKELATYINLNELIEEGYKKRADLFELEKQKVLDKALATFDNAKADDTDITSPKRKKRKLQHEPLNEPQIEQQIEKNGVDTERLYKPDSLYLDYEQNPIKAAKIMDPFIKILGCWFHIFQNNIKKIGKLHLKGDYVHNERFRVAVLLIILTAFLPPHQILPVLTLQFAHLLSVAPNNKKKKVQAYIDYFKMTWLIRYGPELWCVFKRRNRTSDLLERRNKEIKGNVGHLCYWYEFVDWFVEYDADETVEYERLLEQGAGYFSDKRPAACTRERELWDCMKEYEQNGCKDSDSQKYLMQLAYIYTKRVKDKIAIAQLLEECDEAKNDDADALFVERNFERLDTLTYLEDCKLLQILRGDQANDAAQFLKVWDEYIQLNGVWRSKTKMKKYISKQNDKNLKIYKGHIKYLLNAVVAIQFGRRWRAAFIAWISMEGMALIYMNEVTKSATQHHSVIDDLLHSIREGHIAKL